MVERIDVLRTERLVLRRWRDDDRAPFAALNADPVVCRHLPTTLSRSASDELVERIESHFVEHGFGLWCVEPVEHAEPSEAAAPAARGGPGGRAGRGRSGCVGYVGLSVPTFDAPFLPAVEVGWRLARPVWGRGYATEAATACLDAAFGPIGLHQVVSFTVPANVASRAVMERLGMTTDPAEDFDHPRLAPGHPLRRHVLYRVDAATWSARRPSAAGP